MIKKCGFRLYTLTNISFMDAGHHLNFTPTLFTTDADVKQSLEQTEVSLKDIVEVVQTEV